MINSHIRRMSTLFDQEIAIIEPHRRRIPRQERSRQRVEGILTAARELVAETGSESLTMSQIAERAGVPIGSVYQYFPDKPAILRELALRVITVMHARVNELMTDVQDSHDALARVDQLADDYYALFVAEPDTWDIWAAMQSDKELQELDLEDSRRNAATIAEALRPFVATDQQQRVDDVSVLLTYLAGAAARLALASGPQTGQRIMSEFRATVRRQVAELFGED